MVKKKPEKKPKEEKKTKKPAKAEAIQAEEKKPINKKTLPKTKEAVVEEPKQPVELSAVKDRYYEAVGRRKTAVARVRLFTKGSGFFINDKQHTDYFSTAELQKIAEDSLHKMKSFERFRISVHVSGGGLHSQAEAMRHGIARALIIFNPDFRKRLKRAGFLKRDPRMKERKKFGLKKARRAPQWAKR